MSAQPAAKVLPWAHVKRARDLLRQGHELPSVAAILSVRPADLDLSLWRNLGVKL